MALSCVGASRSAPSTGDQPGTPLAQCPRQSAPRRQRSAQLAAAPPARDWQLVGGIVKGPHRATKYHQFHRRDRKGWVRGIPDGCFAGTVWARHRLPTRGLQPRKRPGLNGLAEPG